MKIKLTIALTFIVLLLQGCQKDKIVLDVQSGKKTLECNMKDGLRTINGHKVIDLDYTTGRWIFTNGSVLSTNCEVY